MRANRLRDRGTVAHRHEADALLERPGDVVLVFRGVSRSVIMRCPDGCGEIITVNLDPRTAKAWHFYKKRNQISIFPSVWRDTGCQSHFIVWNHVIVWCDLSRAGGEVVVEEIATLQQRVFELFNSGWQHYTEIAQILDEVPWDVEWICRRLVRTRSDVEAGTGKILGYFRKTDW